MFYYEDYKGRHLITLKKACPEWINSDCPDIRYYGIIGCDLTKKQFEKMVDNYRKLDPEEYNTADLFNYLKAKKVNCVWIKPIDIFF
jgi:hypothetical protein